MLDHVPELLRGLAPRSAASTTDEFETQVRAFFDDARHPTLGIPYAGTGYQPMIELLRYRRSQRLPGLHLHRRRP